MRHEISNKKKHYFPSTITARGYGEVDILLIGAGGIGGQVLSGLARMNVALKHLGHGGFAVSVVDGDRVSEANVGRQLFSPVDVGLNKAIVQVNRVNNFFGFGWEAYPVSVGKKDFTNMQKRFDIVITAVDNVEARQMVAREKSKYQYWLDTGCTMKSGQVVLGTGMKYQYSTEGNVKKDGVVNTLPNACDLYPDMSREEKGKHQGPSCSIAQALRRQDLFVNQWVATAAVELLWQGFRNGFIDNHGAFINLKTMSVRPLPVDPGLWKRMGWPKEKRGRGKGSMSVTELIA